MPPSIWWAISCSPPALTSMRTRRGKRILECLNSADGSTIWETPLEVNPWGGADRRGGSGAGRMQQYPLRQEVLNQARGQIVAVDLGTGKIRWKKDVAGGVLSPLAISGNVAVFTASDGHVYAWDPATGSEKWNYDAKAPFFAGPAISGGMCMPPIKGDSSCLCNWPTESSTGSST